MQVLAAVQRLVFVVYLPFGGQAVQPLVRAGDYAVRQAAWYCAAKLLTVAAATVQPAALTGLALSLWVC